jgi:hypothetical protein
MMPPHPARSARSSGHAITAGSPAGIPPGGARRLSHLKARLEMEL